MLFFFFFPGYVRDMQTIFLRTVFQGVFMIGVKLQIVPVMICLLQSRFIQDYTDSLDISCLVPSSQRQTGKLLVP